MIPIPAALKKLMKPPVTTDEQKKLAMRKLTRAKVSLSTSEQFREAVGVLSYMVHHITDDIPTAGTDGINCWWNCAWILSMKPKQIAYVVIHEAGHVLFLHNNTAQRLKQINMNAGARAIDEVINNWIEDCDPTHSVVEFPTDAQGQPFGHLDRKYQRWSAIQVFRDLMQGAQKGGGGGSPAQGFDEHVFVNLTQEQAHDIDVAIQYGKQAASAHGNANRDADLSAQDRTTKNYLAYLSQWLYGYLGKGQQLANWRRPNPKLAYRGIYMPSRKGQSLRRFVMTIDTSGSMGGEEISSAIAIAKNIVKTFGCDEMHLLYWDTHVAQHEVYKLATDEKTLNKTKPAGGGGTSFEPVMRYIEQHNLKPDVMVTVTDGYVGGWGDKPKFPSLFLITSDVRAPWGETMRV